MIHIVILMVILGTTYQIDMALGYLIGICVTHIIAIVKREYHKVVEK